MIWAEFEPAIRVQVVKDHEPKFIKMSVQDKVNTMLRYCHLRRHQ
jgi:hypothetical protein